MPVPDPLLGIDGPVVVVTGRVARRLSAPLTDLLRRARDNGERLDEDLVATVRAICMADRAYTEGRIRASLVSANGHEEQPNEDMASDWRGHAGHISVAEAAERSGLGIRHVRRLAAEGRFGGRRVGSAHLVDPVALAEFMTEQGER